MRLLIIAPYACIDAGHDADLLRLRGYEVTTWFELHQPEYLLNDGMVASEQRATQNMVVELIQGTVAVLHPQCGPEQALNMLTLCRMLFVPLVRMEDLDACDHGMTGELVDHHSLANDEAYREGLVSTVLHKHLDRAEPAPYGLRVVHGPGVERTAVVRGDMRSPRTWMHRLHGVEQRLNQWLEGLKNPNSRQAAVRPYKLDTSPPMVTG